jgi:solute carrier family 13 (sodium-dependent dicarboxylate transporter), member 2/3/5
MKRWAVLIVTVILLVLVPQYFVESEIYARVLSIAGVSILLWISEVVPPFVPTLLLWTLVPVCLTPLDSQYNISTVLKWAADPVMALFFGGFILGVAAERNGLDKRLTSLAFRSSGRSFKRFLLFVIFTTAFLTMWMSNIAAAALVLACLHPIITKFDQDHILRRMLLIGIAFGANFGGIATPIGTGPNAIAIASISAVQQVTFLNWMLFAIPLTVGMLLLSYLLLSHRVRSSESDWTFDHNGLEDPFFVGESSAQKGDKQALFLFVFIGTIAFWLTEPIHGIPASVVALGSAAMTGQHFC